MSNKDSVPSILRGIKQSNYKKKIKIRYKKLQSGSYSLYFDIWHNQKRDYKILSIYIEGKRDTVVDDNNKIRKVLALRDQKEKELMENDTGFTLTSREVRMNFISYFRSLIDNGKKHVSWESTYIYLNAFAKGNIRICDIDKKFCIEFREFLLENVARNTAKTYFAKLKTALNELVKKDIISKNPAIGININEIETKREFLTEEELRVLSSTKCKDGDTKNSFLFSCFTGLRISDIRLLKFSDVKEGYLYFMDKKTKNVNRMKLNSTALKIMENQKSSSNDDFVFHLKSSPYTCKIIRLWASEAGINKHITFHCARHTFATLCLTSDIDLYTVSKLLGHKDIRNTQIYAKLIDKKKDEAVDKLPSI